jgi:hypothetical protein
MTELPHPSEFEVEETSDDSPTIPDGMGEEEDTGAEETAAQEAVRVLRVSTSLRVPVFKVRETNAADRTDGYEEYMMLGAYTGGDLTHARHRVRVRLDEVADLWDGMEGWEFYMANKPRTDKGVDLAKTEAEPDLAAERRRLKRLEGRLTEEIERMEQEAKFCSRAYTLLSRGT